MKKKYKNFSVIMSLYDGIDILLYKKSLKSLLNQTCLPKEIIIVLDGVKKKKLIEETLNFQKKFKNLKIIKNSKNLGISKSYNKALKFVTYEIVAIQDSDDISLSKRFEIQYKFITSKKYISVLGSSVYEKYLSSGKIILKKNPLKLQQIKKNLSFRNPMNHPTIMFKKKLLVSIGGYKEINRMEDYYLWIRLINSGAVLENLKRPLVIMNVKEDFLLRRTGFDLVKSEILIQFSLFRYRLNNFFIMIMLMLLKSIYHLTPSFIKKLIRIFYFRNLLNK
ncbi:glycosyltransferase [Candidatus Pelagibacter sp. HIMB1746]|uniref:glycosyltransferase n=1 Tax=Candidatus Pelagibacter sp. HIMB1746 TaxID=3413370 RepID=UPI003F841FA7